MAYVCKQKFPLSTSITQRSKTLTAVSDYPERIESAGQPSSIALGAQSVKTLMGRLELLGVARDEARRFKNSK
jgi:hypothetical protein